jgi:hypothetical protein
LRMLFSPSTIDRYYLRQTLPVGAIFGTPPETFPFCSLGREERLPQRNLAVGTAPNVSEHSPINGVAQEMLSLTEGNYPLRHRLGHMRMALLSVRLAGMRSWT